MKRLYHQPLDSNLKLACCVALALAITVFAFSPRLWLMRHNSPGTYQWDRAHTYLLQCAEPLRRDIEPAMFWRLLPPIASKALGLQGYYPLALPILGLAAFAGYVGVILRRRVADPRFVFGGLLLTITTSAGLVPFHWLGINDAWVWLGLLAAAFGQSRWAIPIACLLCPWIDERFIIGLPLALIVRAHDRSESLSWKTAFTATLLLLPYATIRLAFSFNPTVTNATFGFLKAHIQQVLVILPWAPLGWWMGLRLAWLPIIYALREGRWMLRFSALVTAGVSLVLAADISRSIAILLPITLLGVFEFAHHKRESAPQTLLFLGCMAVLVPAAHVVYTKIDVVNPLPIEIFRLLR